MIENKKPILAANCFGGKKIGLSAKGKNLTTLEAIRDKGLNFPKLNPRSAKSIVRKTGIKM